MAEHNTVADTFKNDPTKRFYQFLRQKVDSAQMTMEEVAKMFRKPPKEGEEEANSNYRVFLSQLKSGKNGVTVEQILKAQYNLKLSPAYLFGELESNPASVLTEDAPIYIQPGDHRIGTILHSIFKKHNTEVKSYAEQRLAISEQQMHNYFSGKSRIPFDVVLTVCQDHTESLDLFRTMPMPKGHLLEKNKYLEELVAAQRELLNVMHKKKN